MILEAKTAAELRVLVGYLGEQAPAWWPSQFFGATATAFLTPVFSRSMFQAQCQGVTAAAARLHDEFIGHGRTLHLFRLPEVFEQSIAASLADSQFQAAAREAVSSKDRALTRLSALSSKATTAEGPVVVGDWSDSLDGALQTMAGLYYDAFTKGIKTFPYLREV